MMYSELNDLLHHSVGTPSTTLNVRPSTSSEAQESLEPARVLPAAAPKTSNGKGGGATGSNARLRGSKLDDSDIPEAGTGRVKEVSAYFK